MKIDELKNKLEKATVAVATINHYNKPHNIAIMYAKVVEGRVIITNNFMHSTVENIIKNPFVSLIFWEGEDGWRIDGKADYYDYGKWLDFVKALPENKDLPAKGAIVIDVSEIKELG